MSNKDFYNVNEELENIRDIYFQSVGHELFSKHRNEKQIEDKLSELRLLSTRELKDKAIEDFYQIETGEAEQDRLSELELEIALIFCIIPLDPKNEEDLKKVNEYWKQKERNIKNIEQQNDKVVIEIAACHPLLEDGLPNEEFRSRLERAIQIYNLEKQKGNDVILYVPGSVHSITNEEGKLITDCMSLSESGKNYLVSRGVPESDIRADETNEKYKEDGVYNSGDETLVSTRIAEDEECNRVIAIISPVQIYRKALFFIEFGYIPEIHTVPLENLAHNYIGETFFSLYVTYFKDHNWQQGFLTAKTRQERDSNFIITERIKEVLEKGEYIPEFIKHLRIIETEKYKRANQNMQEAADYSGIVIDYVHRKNTEDKSENKRILMEEIRNIADIYNKHKEESVTIYTNLQEGEINALKEMLNLMYGIEDCDFVTQKNAEQIGYEFDMKKAGRMFGIYPADQAMSRAIQHIETGHIPLVETVPSKYDDYIKYISELYEELIFNRAHKNEQER